MTSIFDKEPVTQQPTQEQDPKRTTQVASRGWTSNLASPIAKAGADIGIGLGKAAAERVAKIPLAFEKGAWKLEEWVLGLFWKKLKEESKGTDIPFFESAIQASQARGGVQQLSKGIGWAGMDIGASVLAGAGAGSLIGAWMRSSGMYNQISKIGKLKKIQQIQQLADKNNKLAKLAVGSSKVVGTAIKKDAPFTAAYDLITEWDISIDDMAIGIGTGVAFRGVWKALEKPMGQLSNKLQTMNVISGTKLKKFAKISQWLQEGKFELDELAEWAAWNKLKVWQSQEKAWKLMAKAFSEWVDSPITAEEVSRMLAQRGFVGKSRNEMTALADSLVKEADFKLDDLLGFLDEIAPVPISKQSGTALTKQLNLMLDDMVWPEASESFIKNLASKGAKELKRLQELKWKKFYTLRDAREIQKLASKNLSNFLASGDPSHAKIAKNNAELYFEAKKVIESHAGKIIKGNASRVSNRFGQKFVDQADDAVRNLNKEIQINTVLREGLFEKDINEAASSFILTLLISGGALTGLTKANDLDGAVSVMTGIGWGVLSATLLKSPKMTTGLAWALRKLSASEMEILEEWMKGNLLNDEVTKKTVEGIFTKINKSLTWMAKEWILRLPLATLDYLWDTISGDQQKEIPAEEKIQSSINQLKELRKTASSKMIKKIDETLKIREQQIMELNQ